MSDDPDPSELLDPIERIRAGLAEARRRALTPFGAESHRWKTRKRLSARKVAAFEAEHGVTLPEGYRRFVTEIGNGGAGPYYGVPKLSKAGEVSPLDALATPCLLEPGGELPAAPDDETGRVEHACRGTLTVAVQGCTYYTQLVVSGPRAGRLFNVDAGGDEAPQWVDAPDFSTWYARWLDRLLSSGDDGWWGYGCTEGEAELWRGLRDGPADERAFRLAAVPRLGEVSGRLRDVVRALCDEGEAAAFSALAGCATVDDVERLAGALAADDPEVRYAAFGGLRRVAPDRCRAMLAEQIADRDPRVRRGALAVAVELGDGVTAARGLLGDDDPEVLRAALGALADAGALRSADVTPLVADPRPEVASHALWRLESLPPGPLPPEVTARLRDPDWGVQIAVLQALQPAWAAELLDPLARWLAQEADPTIRNNLLLALARSDDDRALFPLIGALQREGMDRFEAINALRAFGRRAALPALRAHLGDDTMPSRVDEDGITTQGTAWSIGECAARAIAAIEQGER